MTNFQVYRKTLSFSLLSFVVEIGAFLVLIGTSVAGFFIANSSTEAALIGLLVGFVIGIILVTLINIFITNRIKAAQIAMMTKGVTEGELPEKTFKAGFEELRGRFAKITLFFFITNAIKGIFRQIGRSINRIGTALGGDVGNGITSAIDSAIQTLISYLCDCCLAWVLYRKDQNSALAACEGAVIFFKHGKTLFRNIGRIFGMGFLFFVLVAGGFFGISYLILFNMPDVFQPLLKALQDFAGSDYPEVLNNPTMVTIIASAIIGVVMYSILHSVLIRPFILTGVMRNFMAAGKEHIPTESEFAELEKKSPRFAKLRNSANNG